MEDVVTSVVQNAPIDEAVSAPAATAQESAAGLDEQTDKLNDLMDLVGELVIASASANLLAHRSGQYAGLDAVKQDIAALRGSVSVSSKPGEGSRFAIRLPLTLAIIDGFLVGVDKASYVIPLDNVVECIELKTCQLTATSSTCVARRCLSSACASYSSSKARRRHAKTLSSCSLPANGRASSSMR